jgi:hypothetical protein
MTRTDSEGRRLQVGDRVENEHFGHGSFAGYIGETPCVHRDDGRAGGGIDGSWYCTGLDIEPLAPAHEAAPTFATRGDNPGQAVEPKRCQNCIGLLPAVQHCERILILGQPMRRLPDKGVCCCWEGTTS